MQYAKIFLRGVYGMYSWHTNEEITLGQRVLVEFKKQKQVGFVVEITKTKPEFDTNPILQTFSDFSVDSAHLERLFHLSQALLVDYEQVLGLALPRFLFEESILSPKYFQLNKKLTKEAKENLKGKNQQYILHLLEKNPHGMEYHSLIADKKGATVRKMIEKGVLVPCPAPKYDLQYTQAHKPNAKQVEIIEKIQRSDKPSLIWGVTGSGKTLIYKEIIHNILQNEDAGQALLLVPEISLTSSLKKRIIDAFGALVGVMHSELTQKERRELYIGVQNGQKRVILGTRSALWLPYANLQGIIMDEEHDMSYKNEKNPRYLAHRVVDFLCGTGMKTMYGSATPRLESLHKAGKGEWDFYQLTEKASTIKQNKETNTAKPPVQLINLLNHAKKGHDGLITEYLQEKIEQHLAKKSQILLLLNKRGAYQQVFCKSCGSGVECPRCSTNLKLHTNPKKHFSCHICGFRRMWDNKCGGCKTPKWNMGGVGTQTAMLELEKLFPKEKILRIDTDTIKKRSELQQNLEKFDNGEISILLGTQMISKGIDFANVGLVAVLNADTGLLIPDFRSEERQMAQLTQVFGRGGRRGQDFEVIIQSWKPELAFWEMVKAADSKYWYKMVMTKRKKFNLPPFCNMARVIYREKSEKTAIKKATKLLEILKEKEVEAWVTPLMFVKQFHHFYYQVVLKANDDKAIKKIIKENKEYFPSGFMLDLDPVSFV